MQLGPPVRHRFRIAWALLLAAVAWAHLWRLAEVPRGLYLDESSVGWNAALIVERGEDEHGVGWPIFFRAFGEYKNPLHIYLTALVFALAGVSVTALRAASFLFFAGFLAALAGLARSLFPGSRAVALWAVAAAGFLPWFFALSRIAFEVVSQLTVVGLALWLLRAAWRQEGGRPWLALAAGAALGLSVYAYSTSRLLAPLSVAAAVAAAPGRRWWRCHIATGVGFAAAVVPYLWFVLTHPGALTGRFRALSYVDDAALSTWGKATTFVREYLSYFGPTFLLTGGDPNPRHATGLTGEAFVTVVALALVGLVTLARSGGFRRDPFWRLLLLLALAAPVPAALMTESRHSLRSLLLGLCLVLFSCAGLDRLARLADPADRRAALAAVAAALALEASVAVHRYFTVYPQVSAAAFGSWDFRRALATAIDQRPAEIVLANDGMTPLAHLELYRRTLPPTAVPMRLGRPAPRPGLCILFQAPRSAPEVPGLPSRLWGETEVVKLRCYRAPGDQGDDRAAVSRFAGPGAPEHQYENPRRRR